jgi:hypothetical protein
MTSVIKICNDALSYLGIPSIDSLTENSQAARVCKQFYESTRDAYLEEHNWSFAVKHTALTEVSLPTEYSNYFNYGYSYPARCLRILSIKDEGSKRDRVFEIKIQTVSIGGDRKLILANVNPAWAEIILAVADPLLFSSLFSQALSQRMAYKMSMPLTRNFKIQQNALKDFLLLDKTELREAPPLPWRESRRFNSIYSEEY